MRINMLKLVEYLGARYCPTVRMEDQDFQDGTYSIRDYSGGNVDDAYDMGVQDGRQMFIETLLKKIEAGEFND